MKVAVHAHMHYADLMGQVAGYLRNIPVPFDLIVTLTDPDAKQEVRSTVQSLVPQARLIMVQVENKGRDVKPLYTDIAPLLNGYDVIGHIHGKKSSFNQGATSGWLDYLLDALMGNEAIVERIFSVFSEDPQAGLIYPATYYKMPYWANTWLSNRGWAESLRHRLRLGELPPSYFSYPVGNMFWARAEALKPLLELGLKAEDYPPETGQNDGEIMHALERMVAVTSNARGHNNYVINRQADGGVELVDQKDGIDFSGYYANSLSQLRLVIQRPEIAVVSFDIFDTLIFRCLTDPTDIFDLMQPEVERTAGRAVPFKQMRQEADSFLRSRLPAGRDVTINEIYRRIGALLQLSPAEVDKLQAIELRMEWKFMRARSTVAEVLDFAYDEGKQVVLTSDMYLEKSYVESLLRGLGITRYHRIYLSSDIGKRKDNRTLFPYILEQEGVAPQQLLHIGDSEHSDLQIPGDLGITVFHVMRARELFLQTRLAKTGYPGPWDKLSLFNRVTLGLQFTRQFDQPFPAGKSPVNGDLHTFGYCCFGPTLLAFMSWVAERAREDKITTLYFLARDGDILVRIYRLLQAWLPGGTPEGIYLEVSRRSIGVPFIKQRDQLDKLLQPRYPGGSLRELIHIRLGIDLPAYPDIDVREFGFNSVYSIVTIPGDLDKIKRLCYRLLSVCAGHFEQEKQHSLEYLTQMGLFQKGNKAVIDIGYSGTLQRLLNDAGTGQPIDGYYMVLYKTIDNLLQGPNIRAQGLFGDRIDPYLKELSVDRYSLFYEMVLSAIQGPVVNYTAQGNGTCCPVYAPVSIAEQDKLSKLPVIHKGILDYCRDLLGLLDGCSLIRWDDHQFLLAPFQSFLEDPCEEDLSMLAGYSLDDDYCGQGILYWSSGPDFLWKRYVPNAPLWSPRDRSGHPEKLGGFANRRDYEIFSWYQQQYEALPIWYKRLGQLFKVFKGRKKIRIVLEDVGYTRQQPSKAQEIQAWYDKEYEVLPLWYKRIGQLVRIARGKRGWTGEKKPTNSH